MTKEEAIEAARSAALADGWTLASPEPARVVERAKMICGDSGARGWKVVFHRDMTGRPEWDEDEHVIVEVSEPSGDVFVVPLI